MTLRFQFHPIIYLLLTVQSVNMNLSNALSTKASPSKLYLVTDLWLEKIQIRKCCIKLLKNSLNLATIFRQTLSNSVQVERTRKNKYLMCAVLKISFGVREREREEERRRESGTKASTACSTGMYLNSSRVSEQREKSSRLGQFIENP